jgi:hypothetical protein
MWTPYPAGRLALPRAMSPRGEHLERMRLDAGRIVKIALAGGLLVYLALRVVTLAADPYTAGLVNDTDARLYRDAGHRILAGGPVYPAFQLAGPYVMTQRPELYPPPTMLLLVAPMSALPAFLWWLVPLGMLAAVVVRHRPSFAGWIGILACLAGPNTAFVILAGNPVIWAVAFVALGTVFRGAAVLALVKPSLAPFALVGIESRRWWLVTAAYVGVSLLMLPLWLEYVTVLRNGVGLDGLYSVGHVPIMLIPVVAWVARTRA